MAEAPRESSSARPSPSGGGPILPALDALRGVAILAVFTQHLGDRFLPLVRAALGRAFAPAILPWALTILHHAWWGVDLFFAVSGFSLAMSFVRAYAPGTEARAAPRARDFWRRRAVRLLPAYLVALAVTILVHHRVVADPSFPASLAAHLALLQGYFAPGGIVLIGAAWSLTTEAHFYLLFPLFARPLLTRARPLRAILLGAAICSFAWILREGLHAVVLDGHPALFELTQRRLVLCRIDEFVLGALGALAREAILASRRREQFIRAAPAALAIAVVLLVVAFRLEGALYLEPGGSWPYALLSLTTAAIVLSACLSEGRARAVVAPAPLVAIGIVSYGVFLYHELILGVVGAVVPFARGEPSATTLFWTATLALGASLLAGHLSWTRIELPILRRARPKRATPMAFERSPEVRDPAR